MASNTFPVILQESENWIRVALSIQHLLKPALLKTLHNDDNDPSYTGLSRDKRKLYTEVVAVKATCTKEFDKFLKGQLNLILPSDGTNETDSSLWDIPTIHFFIRNGTTLPPPYGGYKRPALPPNPGGITPTTNFDVQSFYCWDAKQLRNEIFHSSDFNIDNSKLTLYFQRIKVILNAVNYHSTIIQEIQTGSLACFLQSSVNALKMKLSYVSNDVNVIQSNQSRHAEMILDLFKKLEYQNTEFLSNQKSQIQSMVTQIIRKEIQCKVFNEMKTMMECSQQEILAKLQGMMQEIKLKSSQNTRLQFNDSRRLILNAENEMNKIWLNSEAIPFNNEHSK